MRKEPRCSGQGSVGRKKQGMAHASQGHLEDWMIMGRVRHLSPWGCRFGRCAAGVSNAPVTLSFLGLGQNSRFWRVTGSQFLHKRLPKYIRALAVNHLILSSFPWSDENELLPHLWPTVKATCLRHQLERSKVQISTGQNRGMSFFKKQSRSPTTKKKSMGNSGYSLT